MTYSVMTGWSGPFAGRPHSIFNTFTIFTSNFNRKNIKIHNRKILQEFRKSLRNNSTPAEVQLWKLLKNKQVAGLKFRRQHSIENYIVDFYCPEIKLAIEMDGQSHASHAKQSLDQERDARINVLGITILRFENKVVFEKPEEIIRQIRHLFRRCLALILLSGISLRRFFPFIVIPGFYPGL